MCLLCDQNICKDFPNSLVLLTDLATLVELLDSVRRLTIVLVDLFDFAEDATVANVPHLIIISLLSILDLFKI